MQEANQVSPGVRTRRHQARGAALAPTVTQVKMEAAGHASEEEVDQIKIDYLVPQKTQVQNNQKNKGAAKKGKA